MYLMCANEKVENNTFKYAFGFSDEQFNKMIELRKDKGFFTYKQLKYEIVIDKPKTLKTGKTKAPKLQVSNKVRIKTDLKGLTCVTKYYLDGKHKTIAQLEGIIGAIAPTIRYNTKNCKSAILNGHNISIKRFITDKFSALNVKTEETTYFKTILETEKALKTTEGNIYNALSSSYLIHGIYKMKRTFKEIK